MENNHFKENDLSHWIEKHHLPLFLLTIFQENHWTTVEELGKAWAKDYPFVASKIKKKKDFAERLHLALDEAEQYYHHLEKRRLLLQDDDDDDDEEEEEEEEEDEEEVEKKSEVVEVEVEDSSSAPVSVVGIKDLSLSPSTTSSVQPELTTWLFDKSLPPEIIKEFMKIGILTLEDLQNLSEERLERIIQIMKPIPRKKFYNQWKELKTKTTTAAAPAVAVAVAIGTLTPPVPPPPFSSTPSLPSSSLPPVVALQEELHEWLKSKGLVFAVEGLQRHRVLSMEDLKKVNEEVLNQAMEDTGIKPIPKKKFLTTVQELQKSSSTPPRATLAAAAVATPSPPPLPSVPPAVISTPPVAGRFVDDFGEFDDFLDDKKEAFWLCLSCDILNGLHQPLCSKCKTSSGRYFPEDEKPKRDMEDSKKAPLSDKFPSTKSPLEYNWECVLCHKMNSNDDRKCVDCFATRDGKANDYYYHTPEPSGKAGRSGSGSGGGSGAKDEGGGRDHSFYSRGGYHALPDGLKPKKLNTCKKCKKPTEKKFFCLDCVETHEKKTGKRFNGYCNNCLNCREMTLNDEFCDSCLPRASGKRYYSLPHSRGTGPPDSTPPPAPEILTFPARPKEDEGWKCSICRATNSLSAERCKDCFTPRSSLSVGFNNRRLPKPKDWKCVVCSTRNFHKSEKCETCFIAGKYSPAPLKPAEKELNCCLKCSGLTEKKFFCLSCIEKHEKKTGKPFNGLCNDCKICKAKTLNDEYCDACSKP